MTFVTSIFYVYPHAVLLFRLLTNIMLYYYLDFWEDP